MAWQSYPLRKSNLFQRKQNNGGVIPDERISNTFGTTCRGGSRCTSINVMNSKVNKNIFWSEATEKLCSPAWSKQVNIILVATYRWEIGSLQRGHNAGCVRATRTMQTLRKKKAKPMKKKCIDKGSQTQWQTCKTGDYNSLKMDRKEDVSCNGRTKLAASW